MKKNEIIELNGVEYTLELNRNSFLQIDRICDIQKTMNSISKDLYEHLDDIDDNYNPLEDITNDVIEKEVSEKEESIKKLVTRAMFIWLYPNHKLTITQVKEMLQPYFDDEEKAEWIGDKIVDLLNKCVDMIPDNTSKNKIPLANKK